MTFAPDLSFYWGVGWLSILLEGEMLIYFHLFIKWNQNIINVEVCVHLNPLLHENLRWLPRFGDHRRHHEWKRFLSAVDCSHGLINTWWRFCVHCNLFLAEASMVKSFSSEKKTISALLCQPSNFLTYKRYCLFLIM